MYILCTIPTFIHTFNITLWIHIIIMSTSLYANHYNTTPSMQLYQTFTVDLTYYCIYVKSINMIKYCLIFPYQISYQYLLFNSIILIYVIWSSNYYNSTFQTPIIFLIVYFIQTMYPVMLYYNLYLLYIASCIFHIIKVEDYNKPIC